MTDDIQTLKDQLAGARESARTSYAPYRDALSSVDAARSRAAELRQQAEETPRILGIFRGSKVRALLAEADAADLKAEQEADRASGMVGKAVESGLQVRDLESRLEKAERAQREREERDAAREETERDIQRRRPINQAIHTDVKRGLLPEEEAYDRGFIRENIWSSYEQKLAERPLERDDDLFGDEEVENTQGLSIWDTDTDTSSDDDGYADAETDAIEDQLTVRSLDLSVDAGTRTYEQVYTPDGAIRQELVRERDEPEQAQEQAVEVAVPEPEPELQQPTQPQPPSRGGFEIDF